MLTPAQQATLKAYIEANKTWMAYPHNSDGAFQIAAELQGESKYVVWRTDVTESEIIGNKSREATTWDWTAFIARSVGEKSGYDLMFKSGNVDASKANIKDGFSAIFPGGAGAGQRKHIEAISKRVANILEGLFAAGTGSIAAPGTMTVEGSISYREVMTGMDW